MTTSLSYEIHKLTSRLDRAADQLLQRETGITYARFLMLFGVQQGARSQRELAMWLGVTEPSVSRMVGVLATDGLLDVSAVPGTGNRRLLGLTRTGAALVKRSGKILDARFNELVRASGVPLDEYHRHTVALIDQLEADGIGPISQQPNR